MTDKDTEQFENGSVPSENTLTDSYQSLTDSDFDMSGVTSSIYYADVDLRHVVQIIQLQLLYVPSKKLVLNSQINEGASTSRGLNISVTNNVPSTTITPRPKSVIFGEACLKIPQVEIEISRSIVIPLNDWLQRTPVGESILNYYTSFNRLSDKLQLKLCDAILFREFHGVTGRRKITPERFTKLTKEITDLFPSELPGTYYTPKVEKGITEAVAAYGKLIQQYRYFNRKKKGDVVNFNLNKELNRQLENLDPPSSKVDVKEKLTFLEREITPWTTIIKNWEETHEERLNSYKNLREYFERFPCLKQPQAASLLTLDFDIKWPEVAKCMETEWYGSSNVIIYTEDDDGTLTKKRKIPTQSTTGDS
ncbi:uncharacterized protein LOC122851747 [Aphidius gifuensis]|uniref:uncharacterized protein LOC122851747 n=1 Tax=Aphidius gifuensis TaxID=684658 RepID=UPI001CDC91C2|nr:uncharacterized protein LOC122851747 [Aphidius gifuensis]